MRTPRANRGAIVAILCVLAAVTTTAGAQVTRVTAVRGGGTVIQMLPGPDAMADSAAGVIAMMGQLPYTALRDGIFSHPTLAEAINNLFTAMDRNAGEAG